MLLKLLLASALSLSLVGCGEPYNPTGFEPTGRYGYKDHYDINQACAEKIMQKRVGNFTEGKYALRRIQKANWLIAQDCIEPEPWADNPHYNP